jgi:hypothetical protein
MPYKITSDDAHFPTHTAETAAEALKSLRAARKLFPSARVHDERGNVIDDARLMMLLADEHAKQRRKLGDK